jgi:hypothetical protein
LARTDFTTVLHILNLESIDLLFNIDNLMVYMPPSIYSDKDISLIFTSLETTDLTLLYHHEFDNNEYKKTDMTHMTTYLETFITKLKRRYDRLINLIKTDTKIIFLHRISKNIDFDNDVMEFNKLIMKINPNINYLLVFFIDDKMEKYVYAKYNNYLIINLIHFFDKTVIINDWTMPYIKWNDIFKLIDKLSEI